MRKLKFTVSTCFCLLLVSMAGCGTDVDAALFSEVDSLRLIPVDTIGVLMGDSTEMFGNIFDATILPSGELIVVDLLKRCASVFNSSGQFVRQIGRPGSGPGEFQHSPTYVFWLPGSELIAIREDVTGDWLTYSAAGEFTDRRDLAENMIMDIVFLDDSTAVYYTMGVEWNTLDVSYSVQCVDTDTGEPVSDILFHERPMEPSSDFIPGYVMLAGGNGNLYLSRADSQHWSVEIYSRDGALLNTIERTDVTERQHVIQPESEEETPVIPGIEPFTIMTTGENGLSMTKTTNLPEDHPIISALAIDSEDRLWSRRGGFPGNTWDITDTEGNRIAVVDVVLPDSVCHNLIINSYGFIAIDNRSSDFHRVYIMELQEK